MDTRHHIVSQDYLRHFADGSRVRLIARTTASSKVVGIRDDLVERGVNALIIVGADVEELEKQWARIEAQALPDVRCLVADDRDEAGEHGVCVLMALHWARSYVFREMFNEPFRRPIRSSSGRVAASAGQ